MFQLREPVARPSACLSARIAYKLGLSIYDTVKDFNVGTCYLPVKSTLYVHVELTSMMTQRQRLSSMPTRSRGSGRRPRQLSSPSSRPRPRPHQPRLCRSCTSRVRQLRRPKAALTRRRPTSLLSRRGPWCLFACSPSSTARRGSA